MRRCLSVLGATLLLVMMTGGTALAQACERMALSRPVLESWYNPKPDAEDFTVPMPGGMFLVFTRVPLSGSGLYLDEKSTYQMGSSQTVVFETPLEVRVGSSISDASQRAQLLIGKYEFSKGQYVMAMGNGNVARGIRELTARSGDPRNQDVLGEYLREGGPCFEIMTAAIATYLAEPVTFLSYGEYIEVIERLNLFCIERPACQQILMSLGPNPDYPGFLRLPAEHEWEFVARGGRDFVAGNLTRQALQADVPFIPAGKSLRDYAHVDNDPARLEPIGSHEQWFGFYDMIGNAEELMQNPFTAENGFGAVGGYVARGGHFRLATEEVRVSKRVELNVFRRDDVTGAFSAQYFPLTGIRIALGLPIVGVIERTGSDLGTLAQGWAPVSEAGDSAGDLLADAKVLGPIAEQPLIGSDEFTDARDIDFYTLDLRSFASLTIGMQSAKPVKVQVTDTNDITVLDRTIAPGAAAVTTASLLPGTYAIRLETGASTAAADRYTMSISREVARDTGIVRPSTADLANAVTLPSGGQTITNAFVGSGDATDVYPVLIAGSLGGLSATVTGQTGEVSVIFLDDRLQEVARATGGAPLELLAPARTNQRGFVQVRAEGSVSTYYTLTMKPRSLSSPAFVTAITASASSTGTPKTRYDGFLTIAVPRLILPVTLAAPTKLRVELTELTANVDLDVLGANGQRLISSHTRSGNSPEFFEMNLEPGRYFLQSTLRDKASQSKFALYFDQLPYTGGPAPFDPDAARRAATALAAPSSGGQFLNLNNKGVPQYYTLSTTAAQTLLTVDVGGFSAAADLDLYLEDSSGNIISKSENAGDTAEAVSTVLSPGRYYVRVRAAGTSSNAYYFLSVIGTTGMVPADLAYMGELVETSGDWQIRRKENTCYMVTTPQSISPQLGWLREEPNFHIGVERGDDSIYISLQDANEANGADVYRSGSISAYVEHSTRSNESIPARFWTGSSQMKPIYTGSRCSSDFCIDSDSMLAFRRGWSLVITGTSPTGASTRIEYSLTGYTRAAQRINEICSANADWITGQ